MSDLPGDMTKQILLTPARIMRSTRYSLTARGRSVDPSFRLPTGSSSFEKASGWIRVPLPAAGMIPHIALSRYRSTAGSPPPAADDRPAAGGSLEQPPRRAPAEPCHRPARHVEREPRGGIELGMA